jgi:hypothetical protein
MIFETLSIYKLKNISIKFYLLLFFFSNLFGNHCQDCQNYTLSRNPSPFVFNLNYILSKQYELFGVNEICVLSNIEKEGKLLRGWWALKS